MIDTQDFNYKESRLQDLYLFLKNKGFNVYMPEIKSGECTSNYIVVKNDGGNRHNSFSTNVNLYSVMCYVPKQSYSQLEVYVNNVREVMKELQPLFKELGQITTSFYDDSIKAHMMSIEYKCYKKI